MNKEKVELTKYFDNMCDTFCTKKIMFSEWEVFYKKFLDVFMDNKVDIDYLKYMDYLIYAIVYCEDYVDERKYKKEIFELKLIFNKLKIY